MRSRFSAFAVSNAGFLLRSWHPDTRPPGLDLDEPIQWLHLEIVDAAGGPGDEEGFVEFRAHYRSGDQPGVLHERSRFRRHDDAWRYLDGVVGR